MEKNPIKGAIFTAIGIGTIVVLTAVSCQKNGKDQVPLYPATAGLLALDCADTISVPRNATGIVTVGTLTKDKIWKLNGITYVGAGQTLTIEPGTKIVTGAPQLYSDPNFGTQTIAGMLVVSRGGRLMADGKMDSPIVFTTLKQLNICGSGCDSAGAGPSVVIVGAAQTNRTSTPVFIGSIPQPPGVAITIGPGYFINNADNSGTIRYVRIEFPGRVLVNDEAIGGLVLAGVGTYTTVSHVQVAYSKGDAFEFHGGTVSPDHLVALAPSDDGLDFNHGYTGTVAPALVLKDPCSNHADANGIEADNDATGTTAMPLTRPVLRHITVLGFANSLTKPGQLFSGARFRRNAVADMEFSIVAGFPTGVRFDAPTAVGGVCNTVVQAFTTIWSPGAPPCINSTSALSIANNFMQLGATASPFFECTNAASYNVEFLLPDLGSPADGTSGDYKGAFDPNTLQRWTTGWTKFDQASCICCN